MKKNGYFYVWLFCLAAVKQQLTQMFQHKKVHRSQRRQRLLRQKHQPPNPFRKRPRQHSLFMVIKEVPHHLEDDTAFLPKKIG